MTDTDNLYMERAIELAETAAVMGEVPVGAVIIRNSDGLIVGSGYNRRECDRNSIAHAEIIAINQACNFLGGWRLSGCSLYVTLEPCPMCCGAIINSRIDKVVFGAYDKKAGSAGSVANLFEFDYNHHPQVKAGVMRQQCETILKDFFKEMRSKKMNSSIRLIEARSDEQLKAIEAMACEIWNEHYKTIISSEQIDYMLDKYQSKSAMKTQIAEQNYHYYFIQRNAQHIGYVAYSVHDSEMFLSKLYILNQYRSKGYAREVLNNLTEICKANNINRIWLTVNKHNSNSIAVYEKLGFKTFRSEKTDIGNGFFMDDFFMEMKITNLFSKEESAVISALQNL